MLRISISLSFSFKNQAKERLSTETDIEMQKAVRTALKWFKQPRERYNWAENWKKLEIEVAVDGLG